jgi:hypothetical protein
MASDFLRQFVTSLSCIAGLAIASTNLPALADPIPSNANNCFSAATSGTNTDSEDSRLAVESAINPPEDSWCRKNNPRYDNDSPDSANLEPDTFACMNNPNPVCDNPPHYSAPLESESFACMNNLNSSCENPEPTCSADE